MLSIYRKEVMVDASRGSYGRLPIWAFLLIILVGLGEFGVPYGRLQSWSPDGEYSFALQAALAVYGVVVAVLLAIYMVLKLVIYIISFSWIRDLPEH